MDTESLRVRDEINFCHQAEQICNEDYDLRSYLPI